MLFYIIIRKCFRSQCKGVSSLCMGCDFFFVKTAQLLDRAFYLAVFCRNVKLYGFFCCNIRIVAYC